jgi:hypothetical protein
VLWPLPIPEYLGLSVELPQAVFVKSLKDRFKFVFVNIHTGDHLELSLSEMFARTKGIYPGWSIAF